MADSHETSRAIELVLDGDADAFRSLVREHSLMVRSFIGSHLHHMDEIDDLAQEVFIKAFKHLNQYQSECDFRAWLRGIARNEMRMHFRTKSRRQANEASFRERISVVIDEALEEQYEKQTDFAIEALLRCISRLPERMKQVVRAGLDGIKAESIATDLSTSLGAVYNLQYRANGLLRDCVVQEVNNAN